MKILKHTEDAGDHRYSVRSDLCSTSACGGPQASLDEVALQHGSFFSQSYACAGRRCIGGPRQQAAARFVHDNAMFFPFV